MKKLFMLTFGVFLFSAAMAQAGVPQVLGEYGDWIAYYYRDSSGAVCYMASTPKQDEGKYTKRGDIYTVVTHRPSEDSFDVVNINAGYTYKKDANVVIKIGSQTFDKLFASGDKAWAMNETADKEIVEAMKKGNRMVIHGRSNRGTATKDTYSLKGFTSAYRAISNKCSKKR